MPTGEPAELGYPLLVKAAAGGGGRGMRVVREPAELDEALAAAAREAEAAFGDGTVFCERYVERPRHVEIQLLADAHGTVVSLGERDCSVQRRHQKVLEESPSPALDPELRAEMSAAAIAFARAIGYQSAGTAEFMLAGREFWFLELNGRIQVEHPVTELVTGVDLVREQLRIAAGERLRVSETQVAGSRGRGAALRRGSAHLPPAGWDGRAAPAPQQVRVDAGVEEGDEVGTSYDPMIAKLIAHGPTRAEALARLADALAETEVAGVTTNLPFLRWLVAHPVVRAGEATTAFLTEHPPLSEPPLRLPDAPWRGGWRLNLPPAPPAPAPDVDSAAHDRAAGPGQRQRDRADAGNGDRRQGRSRRSRRGAAAAARAGGDEDGDAADRALRRDREGRARRGGRPRRRRRPPRRARSRLVGRPPPAAQALRPTRSGARKIAVSATSTAAAIRIVQPSSPVGFTVIAKTIAYM